MSAGTASHSAPRFQSTASAINVGIISQVPHALMPPNDCAASEASIEPRAATIADQIGTEARQTSSPTRSGRHRPVKASGTTA